MSKKSSDKSQTSASDFVFGKKNFQLMIIGLAVIILGFGLMVGDDDPAKFLQLDFRRMTLAPIIVVAGFIIEIFAIMKKSED